MTKENETSPVSNTIHDVTEEISNDEHLSSSSKSSTSEATPLPSFLRETNLEKDSSKDDTKDKGEFSSSHDLDDSLWNPTENINVPNLKEEEHEMSKDNISTKSSVSPLEQINSNIQQMFAVPTKSIETAFHILIQMLQDQANEHTELKTQFQMEQEKTKVFHTMVMNIEKQQKEQQEKYELDFSQLRDQHKDIINQVADIKNEIQVLSYNFHGIDEEQEEQEEEEETEEETKEEEEAKDGNDDFPSIEITEIPPLPETNEMEPKSITNESDDHDDDISTHNSNKESPEEMDQYLEKGNIINEDDLNPVENADEEEKSDDEVHSEPTISDSNESGNTHDIVNEKENNESSSISSEESDTKSTGSEESVREEMDELATRMPISSALHKLRTTTMLKMRASRLTRKASLNISTQKLDAHLTVRNRLERLEECQRKLEQDLEKANSSPTAPNDFSQRLKVLEAFLHGFGVVEKKDDEEIMLDDSIPTNVSMEDNSNTDHLTNIIPLSGEKKEEEKLVTAYEFNNNESNKIEESEQNNNMAEKSDTTADIFKNDSHIETDQFDQHEKCEQPRKSQTGDELEKSVETGEKMSTIYGMMNDTSNVDPTQSKYPDHTAIQESDMKSDSSINMEQKSYSSMNKNVSLIFHLRDQEQKTRERTEQLATQLQALSDKVDQRVSRKSVHDVIGNLSHHETHNESDQSQDNSLLLREVGEINDRIHELSERINGMVSKTDLDTIIHLSLNFNDDDDGGEVNCVDVLTSFKSHIEKQLRYLNQVKLEMADVTKEINLAKKHLSTDMKDKFSDHRNSMTDSLEKVSYDIGACKSYISALDQKIQRLSGNELDDNGSDVDLDERIKHATEAVHKSLEETLSKKLEDLKIIELELERLASQLADRPDQNQIINMLQDLEEALSEKVGNGRTLQTILNNMKIEMKMKTNRDDVFSLVKQIVGETKQGIQDTKDSLMVGRKSSYRCLGCDRLFPNGINGKRARPINHKALPSSNVLTKGQRDYLSRIGRPGALRPLHVSSRLHHSSISSRQRTRSSGAVGLHTNRSSPTKSRRTSHFESYARPTKKHGSF